MFRATVPSRPRVRKRAIGRSCYGQATAHAVIVDAVWTRRTTSDRDDGMMRLPVRVASLSPAVVAMLMGSVLGLAAFVVGIGVAAVLAVGDVSGAAPVLIGVAALLVAVGAVGGAVVWQSVVDRIDWRRLETDQRYQRMGTLGQARSWARWQLDRRDG